MFVGFDMRSPAEAGLGPHEVPTPQAMRAARYPPPPPLLLALTDGFVGAPPGTGESMWTLPRSEFRAAMQRVHDHYRDAVSKGYKMEKTFVLSRAQFDLLRAPETLPFLTKASGAESAAHVRLLLEAIQAKPVLIPEGSTGYLDALVLLDTTFDNIANDREVREKLDGLVLRFLRIVLMLHHVSAYNEGGFRLNGIKQRCMYGHSDVFCRSVILNCVRLFDVSLSQYLVCGKVDYFTHNDLTYALDWFSKRIQDVPRPADPIPLKLWKAMTALEPPVAFLSFTNFISAYEMFRPHRAVADNPDLQVRVLEYVHAACGPEFDGMSKAMDECAAFTSLHQFSVTELTKTRAARAGVPVARAHAISLQRSAANACPECQVCAVYPTGKPCVVQGCTRTPDKRAFQHTTGYHMCDTCQIKLTQKVVQRSLNWVHLKSGAKVRYVALNNTRFEFCMPGESAKYFVDARGVRLDTNLDLSRFGTGTTSGARGSSSSSSSGGGGGAGTSEAPCTLSVQCKLRVTCASDGVETAELRLGNSSIDMFPVNMASFRYTHEGIAQDMIDVPAFKNAQEGGVKHARIKLVDGRVADLDFTHVQRGRDVSAGAKHMPIPFLEHAQTVPATSVALLFTYPSMAPRLDRTDAERKENYSLRSDWASKSEMSIQLRAGTLTTEHAWEVARVDYLVDGQVKSSVVSKDGAAGESVKRAKMG